MTFGEDASRVRAGTARLQVAAKVPAEDKARVVEEFTRDETAAAAAATNLLRRPAVAFKAMSDDFLN